MNARRANLPRFEGEVCTVFELDGRYMMLEKPFSFFDRKGNEWTAPAGLVSDGATIPRFAWPVVGGPFDGKHRRAAILHDAAYAANGILEAASGHSLVYDRYHADLMLWEAMRADGVNFITAAVIYRMVRWFGGLAWLSDGQALLRRRPIR